MREHIWFILAFILLVATCFNIKVDSNPRLCNYIYSTISKTKYKDRGEWGMTKQLISFGGLTSRSETWKAINRAVTEQCSISVFFFLSKIRGSRAGVPPRFLSLWAAFGMTEDASRPCSAVRSWPPADAFVTLQGDTQVLHHGTKRYALPKRKQLKARVRTPVKLLRALTWLCECALRLDQPDTYCIRH